LILVFCVVQAGFLVPDLRIAYLTPEPAYEEAFRYVADQWQPGDVLLTMNTSAAGLYLKGIKDALPGSMGFAVQEDAEQFLLEVGGGPVDRWLGAAWVGTAMDLNRVLAEHRRAWFVVDTIRLPVYYRGDWLASVDTQMNQVWSRDNALVYLTRPDRVPLPTHPDVLLDARLGDMIALNGYSLAQESANTGDSHAGWCEAGQALCLRPGDRFQITLFWQALAAVDADYSVFVHLRNAEGVTVAQRDTQPLDGLYPTSQWQLGETVAQPLEFGLPDNLADGAYVLYVGLYRLDTLTRLPVAHDTSGENAIILDTAINVAADK
jgi:hypothetical protein